MLRKRTDYARVGVRELWLVDPDGPSALILRLPAEPVMPVEYVQVEELESSGVLASPMLPGLVIPLARIVAS